MKAFVPSTFQTRLCFCMLFSDGCPDVSTLSKCSSSFHRADLWSELYLGRSFTSLVPHASGDFTWMCACVYERDEGTEKGPEADLRS